MTTFIRNDKLPKYNKVIEKPYVPSARDLEFVRQVNNIKKQQDTNALQEGVNLLGRPVSAIASAINAPFEGKSPLEEGWRGLSGESDIKTYGDLLERRGVPEGPVAELGPLRVSPRAVAGLAADIVLDPLNLVGGGVAKLTRGAADIARASKGMAKVADNMSNLGNLAPGVTRPATSGMMTTQIAAQLNAPRTPMQRLANANPFTRAINRFINPSVSPVNEGEAAYYARARQLADFAERQKPLYMARVRELLDDQGNIPFVKGSTDDMIVVGGKEVPWNDVFSNPDKYDLTPVERNYIDTTNRISAEIDALMERAGIPINKSNKAPGSTYSPRRIVTDKDSLDFLPSYMRRISIGREMPSMKPRKYGTMQEGLEAGVKYTGPLEALEGFIDDSFRAIADQGMRNQLMPIATVKDLPTINKLTAYTKELAKAGKWYKEFANIVDMANRGAKIPVATLNRLIRTAPDQTNLPQAFKEAMSIKPDRVEKLIRQAIKDYGRGARAILRDDFNQQIKLLSDPSYYPITSPDDLVNYMKRLVKDEKAALKIAQDAYVYGVEENLKRFGSNAVRNIVKDASLARLKAQAKDMVALYTKDVKDARKMLSEFRKQEALKVKGKVSLAQPAFKDMYFDPEDVRVLAQKLGDTKANPFAEWVNKAGQYSRTAQASLDMSAPMIQGLFLLATDPIAWAKGVKAGFKAFLNPRTHQKFLASPEVQQLVGELKGLILSNTEWYEGAQGITKLASKVPVVGKPYVNLMQRSQAAYEAFGDVARIHFAKGLLPIYKAHGVDPSELADLANKALGIVSTKAGGVGATQRAVESGLIFFAPRYIRASAALALDAMTNPGLKGDTARQGMANMLVAGLAAYMKAANELGQEPILDPSDPRFMTLQIENERFGIGSVWMSMARLLSKVIANPNSLREMPEGEWQNNVILKWMRSRFPPASATVMDILSGKTYTGEKIDSPQAVAAYAAGRFMPFWAEGRIMPEVKKRAGIDTGPGMGAGSLVPELLGMRAFPQSYTEQRDQLARQYAKDRGIPVRPFNELTPLEQQEINAQMKAKGLPIRDPNQQRRSDMFDAHAERLNIMATMVANGTINKAQYREARKSAKQELSAQLGMIEEQENAGKSPEQIEQEFTERLHKLTPRDAAREMYYRILYQRNELGQPDWDRAEAFLASLPQATRDYIDETSEARLSNLPPEAEKIEREYKQARDTLKPYWDVLNNVLERYGILDKYNAMTPAEQEQYKQSPQWDIINREVDERHKRLRLTNPAIDRALVEWGYASVPIREQGGSSIISKYMPKVNVGLPSNPLRKYLR